MTTDNGVQPEVNDPAITERITLTSTRKETDISPHDINNNGGVESFVFDIATDIEDEPFVDPMIEEADFDDDVRDPSYVPESSSSDSEQLDFQIDQETVESIRTGTRRELDIQIDHGETVESNKTGKKRKSTGVTKNKQLRMKGKAYRGMKKVDGRWEETRQEISDKFRGTLDCDERKVYMNSLVGSGFQNVKTVENSRRSRSFQYFLWQNNARVQVCKSLFLTTIGIGEYTVYGWCNNSASRIPSKEDKTETRKAEQHRRHDELRQGVRQFLEEIPKLESHYCRASSSKLYLEPLFDTFSSLYKVYLAYCKVKKTKEAHRQVFENVFKEMNLSLFSPKKDLCDTCCSYEAGNINEEYYNIHIQRKNTARAEKELDKERADNDPSLKVINMDLQSVLLCPKLNASALYYKTKLTCHNFTVMDINTKEVHCYFWNESQGDLTANSFASCIADYIEDAIRANNDVKHFMLYSDGCTYQNRNCVLSNMLCHICKKYQVQITQKFLEWGHTQMEVDSVHRVIERKLKHKSVYVPQNYVDVIGEACSVRPYQVKYVDHTFCKKYSDLSYYSTIRPGTNVGDPVVTNIRVLQYNTNGEIQFKLLFHDEFSNLSRRARRSDVVNQDLTPLHCGPLVIKRSKFQHLMELKSVVPADYHPFFDNLNTRYVSVI
ncbi:hypothetical protein MAR_022347 [Mya arenaria]|uniref:DUF7869 domain-containing protein n=1 Tax=Mya arenaria TaxID=6604 RepID=A0ABY7DKU3_MYAAR|nr:hypothetical protein MAR_022347 [Mya arenaria]